MKKSRGEPIGDSTELRSKIKSNDELLSDLTELHLHSRAKSSFGDSRSKQLKKVFNDTFKILNLFKKIEKTRSDKLYDDFENKHLKPFFRNLILACSCLIERFKRQPNGFDLYLDIRIEIAEFFSKEIIDGDCFSVRQQLDIIFENKAFNGSDYIRFANYRNFIILLVSVFKMIDAIMIYNSIERFKNLP